MITRPRQALRVRAESGLNYPFLTQKERDNETGLDYFEARYYSHLQGRFTSIDPENYQAMLDLTDPQSWNAYSYTNNNPLGRIDPDGKGWWDRFKNAFFYGHAVENDEIERMEKERRDWLSQHYYESDREGNLRPYDPSNLSRQDVFDKIREIEHFSRLGQVEKLSDSQVLEAWGKAPIAPTSAGTSGRTPTGSFNTVGQGLKNLRPIETGRLKGFSRANTELSGGSQAAKQTFKQLTGRDPAGSFDRVVQGSKEVVYRASSRSGTAKIDIVDKAQKFVEKISFKP